MANDARYSQTSAIAPGFTNLSSQNGRTRLRIDLSHFSSKGLIVCTGISNVGIAWCLLPARLRSWHAPLLATCPAASKYAQRSLKHSRDALREEFPARTWGSRRRRE